MNKGLANRAQLLSKQQERQAAPSAMRKGENARGAREPGGGPRVVRVSRPGPPTLSTCSPLPRAEEKVQRQFPSLALLCGTSKHPGLFYL